MRVFYITRVNLNSSAAQARQILSMSRAFHELLKEQYTLISPGRLGVETQSFHQPLHWFNNQWLRYLNVCINAMLLTLKNTGAVFITRDIAVAFTIVVFGGRALYEAHKQPIGIIPKQLFKLLCHAKRFKLICISQALSNYYEINFKPFKSKTLVAHSGVFPEEYLPLFAASKTELRKKLNLPLDKIIIAHTGSLYKGGAELYGELAKTNGDSVVFVHVGGSEQECSKWAEYYRQRNLENIRFLPHQPADKIREFQVAADLLFYISTKNSPIYWCTSPLKLFEYMASGTPILGSRLGSVAEVFDEDVGFCFDPDRPETIRESLQSFLNHPDEAKRRAQTALTAVNQHYSWHRRAQAVLDFAKQN